MNNNQGFSLIELLAVLGIFMVLSAVSVIAWNSFGPIMALNGAAEGLGDSLELCMHKARTQKNEFFVVINYNDLIYRTNDNTTFRFTNGTYVLADDDGFDPMVAGSVRQYNTRTMYGGPEQSFRDEWIPDEPTHQTNWRNNNMIESKELFRGPIKLGKGIHFERDTDSRKNPVRIVFSYRQPYMYWHGQNLTATQPISSSFRNVPTIDDPCKIRLANYLYDPNITSHDNYAHLRIVLVSEQKVEVYRPGV